MRKISSRSPYWLSASPCSVARPINESIDFAWEIGECDGFGVELGEARPLRASTDVDVVLVFEAANQADLGRGRTRVRVRTATQPQADLLVAIAEPL